MAVMKAGMKLGGFQISAVQEISEYNSTLIKIIHKPTNLKVLHIVNEDPENLFAFIFRTPVKDNTGIPHILEHSTLCGSRDYPLKDPFVILLKGSMNTYLNAFTGQDCTVYLASSTVKEDFYNLMSVYGDAVFHPLLKREVFDQEGFHYEPADGASLKIQGVVYNEMQGNYSSPESLVDDWSIRSLFPDTTYGYDCGGDPAEIPTLEYRDFLHFHKKYYHPSNCKIFLYGNLDTAGHLAYIEEKFLGGFDFQQVNSSIPAAQRWQQPRIISQAYPVKQGMQQVNKSSITVNWLTAPLSDVLENLKLEVLSEILFGNAGSPLRKDLVESHLGEDISPASGLDTGLKELVFTAGLRGTEPERADAILKQIHATLHSILKHGLDEQVINAALHRVEFRKREMTTGSPYGIKLLFKTLRGWIHDLEPELTLAYEQSLITLKKQIKEKKEFYKTLIKTYLLENSHRSTVIIYPDPQKTDRDQAQTTAKLAALAANPEQMQKINQQLKQLQDFQQTPDSAEDMARIPCLNVKDLPAQITSIPYEKIDLNENASIYFHDIHTNDIVYLDFAFALDALESRYHAFLPLFGKVLLESGMPGIPFAEVANLISLYTGGITTSLTAETSLDGLKKTYLLVSIKFLKEKFAQAIPLLFKLILTADCSERTRIKDLTFELRNKYQSSIIPHGNYYASLRAGSHLSATLKREESWHGIDQVLFLNDLARDFDRKLDQTIACFSDIRKQIFTGDQLLINISCSQENYGLFSEILNRNIRENLPLKGTLPSPTREEVWQSDCQAESIFTSSSVNFIARAFPGTQFGTQEHAVESVLSHLLSTGYLWDKVRLQGGAYGVSASAYNLQGIYTFSSFRDPQINATLQAFKASLEYIKAGNLDEEQLKLAMIGTIGKHEKPLRGARRGFINFKRIICGITDELRQQQRDWILSLDREAFRSYATKLLAQFENGTSVIIGSETAIRQAALENNTLPGLITDLPG